MMMKNDSSEVAIDKNMLSQASDYKGFRTKISTLLANGKVTGHEQNEALIEYTTLNEHRMNRWEKHFVPSDLMKEAMSGISEKRRWVILTEGWCGDSAQAVPVIEQIAQLSEKIVTLYLFRDENDPLMQLFLTNGGRSIPKLICLNDQMEVLWHWGPRPQKANELIADAKAQGLTQDVWKEKLHLWYARNKQENLQEELIELIRAEV